MRRRRVRIGLCAAVAGAGLASPSAASAPPLDDTGEFSVIEAGWIQAQSDPDLQQDEPGHIADVDVCGALDAFNRMAGEDVRQPGNEGLFLALHSFVVVSIERGEMLQIDGYVDPGARTTEAAREAVAEFIRSC